MPRVLREGELKQPSSCSTFIKCHLQNIWMYCTYFLVPPWHLESSAYTFTLLLQLQTIHGVGKYSKKQKSSCNRMSPPLQVSLLPGHHQKAPVILEVTKCLEGWSLAIYSENTKLKKSLKVQYCQSTNIHLCVNPNCKWTYIRCINDY